MRSYTINTDRVINELVPHYIGGRKLILFLQSCMQPLKTINKEFSLMASQKILDANMTSQVILFENYLTNKYNKYFSDVSQKITISEGQVTGTLMYSKDSEHSDKTITLYEEGETPTTGHSTASFRLQNENSIVNAINFVVVCPKINNDLISNDEVISMITYDVNRYRVSGRKFNIVINS